MEDLLTQSLQPLVAMLVAAVVSWLTPIVNPGTAADAPPPSLPSNIPAETELLPVTRVADGDTITVAWRGSDLTVRLIGVDTPEVDGNFTEPECFGTEASTYLREMLADTSVYLTTDSTQDTFDRYDRLLAYVTTPEGLLINQAIIAAGYGREYTYNNPYQYQARFQAAESVARGDQVGLWQPNICLD